MEIPLEALGPYTVIDDHTTLFTLFVGTVGTVGVLDPPLVSMYLAARNTEVTEVVPLSVICDIPAGLTTLVPSRLLHPLLWVPQLKVLPFLPIPSMIIEFLLLVPVMTRCSGLLTVCPMTRTFAARLLPLFPTFLRVVAVWTHVILLFGMTFLLIVVWAVVSVLLIWLPPLPTLILAVVFIHSMVIFLVSPVRCLRSPLPLQLDAVPLTEVWTRVIWVVTLLPPLVLLMTAAPLPPSAIPLVALSTERLVLLTPTFPLAETMAVFARTVTLLSTLPWWLLKFGVP